MTISIRGITSLVAITKVACTAQSKTLATLGVTINPGLTRLALLPDGAVNWAIDAAASGASPAVPLGGIEFPIDAVNAALLQFFAANVTMTVLQFA